MKKLLFGIAILAIAVVSQAQASDTDRAKSVPVLRDIPFIGKMFVPGSGLQVKDRNVPFLSDIPILGTLFKFNVHPQQDQKVPFLGDIPIIGKMFKVKIKDK